MSWRSQILHGQVQHCRHEPVKHAFSYPMSMLGLDLDELPELLARTPWYGCGRAALVRFKRSDYLPQHNGSLREAVHTLCQQETGSIPSGPITLLTNLRFAGIGFNPVSFFLCHNADQSLHSIIAEITNTPWNERHCYVLNAHQGQQQQPGHYRFQFDKSFHISPFNPMRQQYDWQFRLLDKRVAIHMQSVDEQGRVFDAAMQLQSQAANPAGLWRHAITQPFLPLRVLKRIYLQAWKLRRAGAPFHPHPRHQQPTHIDRRPIMSGVSS